MLFFFRNYRTDKTLDNFMLKLIDNDFEVESINDFFIYITTDHLKIKLWNANKYYAWLNCGTVKDKHNNEKYRWHSQMPSKKTMRLFLKVFKKKSAKTLDAQKDAVEKLFDKNHDQLIDVKERLPKDNQYVLAHLTKNNWGDEDDPCGNRYWVVVKFERGISMKERDAMPDSNHRKYEIHSFDEEGNNLRPYCWASFGPSCYFGQEVNYWVELPEVKPEPEDSSERFIYSISPETINKV